MSTEPMMVLLKANLRAGQLRREAVNAPIANPGVLVGAPTHSGAFLLTALDEMGWELGRRPDDDLNAIAERAVVAAHDGVGMDDLHRSISPAQVRAALEMCEAAGLGFTEGEDR
jgi:hypothetical protein